MAMNRNVTMAEKEVRDYAKRQMERAEQRENILFTEEQREQVLEYAAMTGDDYGIRKMIRDLADAVRSSDEEKVNEILRDAREEIDEFPDRSVGMAELKGYGIPQMICFLFVRRWHWSFIVLGKRCTACSQTVPMGTIPAGR